MLHLKKLTLTNWLSHESTELAFGPKSHQLWAGRSGSGKSSMAEAITFALFSKCRLDGRSMVQHGKTTAKVELVLTDGEREITIRRTINKKGTQTLDIGIVSDGKAVGIPATSLKEKQLYVEREILRSSYELFVNSVYYPQGGTDSFVHQTAARRKELLLEIVGAADLEEHAEKAKAKGKSLDVRATELSTESRMILTQLDQLREEAKNDVSVDVASLEAALKEADEVMDKSEESLKAAEAALAPLQSEVLGEGSARREIERCKVEMAGIKVLTDDDVAEVKAKIAIIEEDDVRFAAYKVELESLLRLREAHHRVQNDRQRLSTAEQVAAGALEASRTALGVANTALMANFNAKMDLCPTTNVPCAKVKFLIESQRTVLTDAVNAAGAVVAAKEKVWNEASFALSAIVETPFDETRITELTESLKLQGSGLRLSVLREDLTRNEERRVRINTITGRIVELSAAAAKDSSQKLKDVETAVAQCKSLLKTASDARHAAMSRLDVAEAQKEAVEARKTKIEGLEKKSDDNEAECLHNVEASTRVALVKDAFSSNGIKAVIVDTVLPKLEGSINEILSELTEGFSVKLDTQKASVTDPEKMVEGLYLTVCNAQGEETDVDGLSGGERVKVIFAVTEALASLQRCGFRLLDEAILALDAESIQQFGDALMKMQERFDQVVCISHEPLIQELFDDRLTVTKKAGVSSVK